MYTGIKVVSKQVQDEIPDWLQNLLWYMIETMDVAKKDQTQFFKLTCLKKNGAVKIRIVHQQQRPYYIHEQIVLVNRAISAKVMVVDNVSECFMLILET